MPTALVTGTSTGIGAACVSRLAAAGWTVHAGVRRAEDADQVKASNPGDVRPVMLDVGDRDQMRVVLESIANDSATGGLDGLVNNAGVGNGGPSKHALEALAESQRLEFRRSGSGVRVALVEPGAVKTAIWDKADTTIVDVERALGDVGRPRYQWLTDSARGFAAEGRGFGARPDRVARAVEHALSAPRPRARYLVGIDAKVYGHVVTKLPDRVRDAGVDIGARRYEFLGRRQRKT